jgi:hypothetical protein
MKLRVRIDAWKPLIAEHKIKVSRGNWCVVKLKYEKLDVFCFVSEIKV